MYLSLVDAETFVLMKQRGLLNSLKDENKIELWA